MEKKIRQYKLLKQDNGDWKDNNASSDKAINIATNFLQERVYQLGIQALPGTEFIINEGTPITIGSTGIFQISVNEKYPILSLYFTNSNNNNYILIDTVYERSGDALEIPADCPVSIGGVTLLYNSGTGNLELLKKGDNSK